MLKFWSYLRWRGIRKFPRIIGSTVNLYNERNLAQNGCCIEEKCPQSDNKNFFGGRNYFLFFRLENLSLSLFAQTLSFNRHAMVEEFKSSAKNFFTISSQRYLKNATFDLTKHNGKSVLPDTEDNFQQWPHCIMWL